MASNAGSSRGGNPDEVRGRFTELILAEFGEQSAQEASAPAPREAESLADRTHRRGEVSDFSFGEAFDRLEPDEPEPYVPEELAPMQTPSRAVLVALLLLGGGVISGLILGARQQLAGLSAGLVALSIVGGLALLMSVAVRRPAPEDPDDDGARL